MEQRSRDYKVRVQGELACFTRPEFKVERVSYEVMTPSAARGILEAIMWQHAIKWVVTKIHVLAPIKFINFRRNEVKSRVSLDNVKQGMKGKPFDCLYAGGGSDACAQRNTVALKDVDYVIEAYFVSTPLWKKDNTIYYFQDKFRDRLNNGQVFHQPFLGCREFAAQVEPVEDRIICRLPEEQRNKKLGWMLHDLDFNPPVRPKFFEAEIDENGIVEIPLFKQAVEKAEGRYL